MRDLAVRILVDYVAAPSRRCTAVALAVLEQSVHAHCSQSRSLHP